MKISCYIGEARHKRPQVRWFLWNETPKVVARTLEKGILERLFMVETECSMFYVLKLHSIAVIHFCVLKTTKPSFQRMNFMASKSYFNKLFFLKKEVVLGTRQSTRQLVLFFLSYWLLWTVKNLSHLICMCEQM